MTKDANQPTFAASMQELNQLAEWFQQDNFDLEEALTKLRRGRDLIVQCQKRLSDVENEFMEIKADLEKTVPSDSQNA